MLPIAQWGPQCATQCNPIPLHRHNGLLQRVLMGECSTGQEGEGQSREGRGGEGRGGKERGGDDTCSD